MNQRGLTPIFIIAIAIAIAVSIVIFGVYIWQKPGKEQKPINNQSISKERDCNNSYGGCDTDQNFYKWTDDGLP